MSLTSYLAAPPRAGCFERCVCFLSGLAVSYSPTSFDAVPLPLRHLTSEIGTGSGVLLALWPPDLRRNTLSLDDGDRSEATSVGAGCAELSWSLLLVAL